MPEVVAIGETMVVFCPEQSGPLRHVHRFVKRIAGSESNAAIGLSRLGHSAGWISRLGRDELGEYVLREIRAEGIDVSCVVRDDQAQTGLMVKEIHEGRETRVYYYRKDSAASRMSPVDLNENTWPGASSFTRRGDSCAERIVPRDGRGWLCKAWCQGEFRQTSGCGLSVRARETLLSLIPPADVLLPDSRKRRSSRSSQTRTDSRLSLSLGVKIAALKCRRRVPGGRRRYQAGWLHQGAQVVDPIGAGGRLLRGFSPVSSRVGLSKSAAEWPTWALSSDHLGDFEGLPNRSEFAPSCRAKRWCGEHADDIFSGDRVGSGEEAEPR